MVTSRISSSSDDEEDEGHASRLASVAIDSAAVVLNASSSAPSLRNGRGKLSSDQLAEAENESKETSGLKLYQIRLQDLLYKHLDMTVGEAFAAQPFAAEQTIESHENGLDEVEKDVDIRLFNRAPPGIVIKRPEQKKATKRVKPNLKKGYSIGDEDSAEHLVHLQAAAIDGETIRAEAKHAIAKALAASQASAELAEKAAKQEEERVAQLKRERGEEWLPAIAAQLGLPLKSTKVRASSTTRTVETDNTQTI